ncbi:hypothetical protein [Streptomyces sp. NPDC094032]|uniref:hypothetical protein n=1 Tax=Streptomyces sp. NPDC094032 TaxID=3155308 RepID=UPI003317AD4D
MALAGDIITASMLTVPSNEAEDPVVGRTTSSGAYADASSGPLSAAVTVPVSGRVAVEIRSTQRNSSTANTITSWVAVGSVSGTVYSPNDNAALITPGANNQPLDLRKHLGGLTPGETLTVTIKHRVNNISTQGIFDYRLILIESLWG